MRHLKTTPFLAAILLLGAGCVPSGPAIPSVERIPFPTVSANVHAPDAVPEPVVVPSVVPEGGSGVRGIVLLGPTCPAQKVPDDGSCADKPYVTDLRISTKSGTPVKRFRSGADGRFTVALIPGNYVIGQPPGAPNLPSAQDQEFVVRLDTWTEITVKFDSGIR